MAAPPLAGMGQILAALNALLAESNMTLPADGSTLGGTARAVRGVAATWVPEGVMMFAEEHTMATVYLSLLFNLLLLYALRHMYGLPAKVDKLAADVARLDTKFDVVTNRIDATNNRIDAICARFDALVLWTVGNSSRAPVPGLWPPPGAPMPAAPLAADVPAAPLAADVSDAKHLAPD